MHLHREVLIRVYTENREIDYSLEIVNGLSKDLNGLIIENSLTALCGRSINQTKLLFNINSDSED